MLVPSIKDKCGQINSKDNYLTIALASIVSKIFENVLLDRMSGVLSTMYYLLCAISLVSERNMELTCVYMCVNGS